MTSSFHDLSNTRLLQAFAEVILTAATKFFGVKEILKTRQWNSLSFQEIGSRGIDYPRASYNEGISGSNCREEPKGTLGS